jgi:dinuclear metal center YbgI/SA1388 family protein
MTRPLTEITRFLDTYLRIAEVPDDANAINGLQVEACAQVSRVACAVDAAEPAIEAAIERGAQLLLVHHGMLWGGNRPIVGPHARKLRRCFEAGLSIYSAHLPLDLHPASGNNACLMRALGLEPDGTFGKYQGVEVGLTASCDLTVGELRARLAPAVGEVSLQGRGPERIRRLAVVSGGGGGYAAKAARAGLDALVTGEGAHHQALDAEEHGVHLLLAGHYRTETFGVKALGKLLEEQFALECSFVEHDTGL